MSKLLGEGSGLLTSCTLVIITGSTEEAVEARSREAQGDAFIQSKDPKTFGSSNPNAQVHPWCLVVKEDLVYIQQERIGIATC